MNTIVVNPPNKIQITAISENTYSISAVTQAKKDISVNLLGTPGPAGPPGPSAWGGITGDISDQSDLQSELDSKVGQSDFDHNMEVFDGNGVISGISLSINSDSTKFNISSGTFHRIGDSLPVIYSGSLGITPDFLLSHIATYIAINKDNGNIFQSSSPLTQVQRESYILIGAVIHSDKSTINAINNLPDTALHLLNQFNGQLDAMGMFNIDGNVFTPNGANLKLNKSIGHLFKKGSNFTISPFDPHAKYLPALVAPSNLRYRLSDGTEYADTSEISKYYENPIGSRTVLPNNRFSIQRVTIFSSNLVRIQYGQAIYNTMALAIQALKTEQFAVEQNIMQNGLLRAYIIVKGSCTSLSDASDAIFICPDRWGDVPAGAGGGTTSLQQAYANSAIPQILTNLILGALTFQNGGDVDTLAVTQVRNIVGQITSRINGDGSTEFGDISGLHYLKTLSDGFLAMVGTVYWVDIDFPIIIRTTGANIPVIAPLQGNLTAPEWEVNDLAVCEGQELVHGWKEGTEVFWHIHVYTGALASTNKYLKFEIEYSWSNFDSQLSANVIVLSPDLLIPANTPSRTHKLYSISSFIPASGKIGGHVKARLRRVASTGSAAANPFCEMLQLHIQCDTMGSRNAGAKGSF